MFIYDKLRWLVIDSDKKLFLIDIETLGYLSKYFCREKKYNDILKDS